MPSPVTEPAVTVQVFPLPETVEIEPDAVPVATSVKSDASTPVTGAEKVTV